ncbi:MAG: hypothetical protein AAGD25_22470 [Cyanobacteria bacterium P01_F01_bin.150]
MPQFLETLIKQCQLLDLESESGKETLSTMVKEMLRSPPICRKFQGAELAGIYQVIYDDAHSTLLANLSTVVKGLDLDADAIQAWKVTERNRAFKQVLTEAVLTELAIAAQATSRGSQERTHAVTELIAGLQLAGQLTYRPTASEFDQEITQQILEQLFTKIDTFDPEKANVMAWVNSMKKFARRDNQRKVNDPMAGSIQRQQIKLKSKLRGIFRNAREQGLENWCWLRTKFVVACSGQGIEQSIEQMQRITLLILVVGLVGQLQQTQPQAFDTLLNKMVQATIPSLRREAEEVLARIHQPDYQASRGEQMQQYFQDDPEQLCQKAMRGKPEVTFQAIALLRLDDNSWQDISEHFGEITISSLHTFYKRHLEKIAPQIRAYIETNY